MIVCLCEEVSDGTIRQAISEGCCSIEAIENACGACTCCGVCEMELTQILNESSQAGTEGYSA